MCIGAIGHSSKSVFSFNNEIAFGIYFPLLVDLCADTYSPFSSLDPRPEKNNNAQKVPTVCHQQINKLAPTRTVTEIIVQLRAQLLYGSC